MGDHDNDIDVSWINAIGKGHHGQQRFMNRLHIINILYITYTIYNNVVYIVYIYYILYMYIIYTIYIYIHVYIGPRPTKDAGA